MELATIEKASQIILELEWTKCHLEKLTAAEFQKTTVKIQSDKAELVLSGKFFQREAFLLKYSNAVQDRITELTNQIQSL